MNEVHPAAVEHLPFFVTGPGQQDVLLTVMAAFMVLAVLLAGILFFTLHTLPERLAHKSQKLQFEIVAVLGLLALFTHQHIFWVAGLLLAFIDIPDFGTPLRRMASSLETLAGVKRPPDSTDEDWLAGVDRPPATAEDDPTKPPKLKPVVIDAALHRQKV